MTRGGSGGEQAAPLARHLPKHGLPGPSHDPRGALRPLVPERTG